MECRMTKIPLPIMAWLAVLAQVCAEEAKAPAYAFSGRLSELKEEPGFLGDGWTCPPGVVIDDMKDTSRLRGQSKDMDEAIEVLLGKMPAGTAAYAEFKYLKKQETRYITLRVWVFDKPSSARAWWRTRYEMRDWERFYSKVEGIGDLATDSKELKKRSVLIGNVVLACDEHPDGSRYLEVLDRYMAKMGAKKSK
jgi:hypothetical protein